MPDHIEYKGGFQRHSEPDKPRYTHIPLEGLARVAARGTIGANKYGDNRNWAKADITDPEQKARFDDAIFRHLIQYLTGETDEDHAAAACWNLLALMSLQEIEKTKSAIIEGCPADVTSQSHPQLTPPL